MPPRLAHTKSRKGCQRCKARRVKCDEKHPACSSCSKHGVPCEYGDPFFRVPIPSDNLLRPLPPSEGSSSSSSAGTTPLPIGPASPYSDVGEVDSFYDVEERRALELRLLHHFVTIVTYTFPACNDPHIRDVWNIDCVRSGFEYPFLLNAIIAIAALHLISDTGSKGYFYAKDENTRDVERVSKTHTVPGLPADLGRVHRLYMNMAIRQQREAIQKLSTDNADAIFMASILLAYQSVKLIPDHPASAPYSPPTQWLRMSKAIYAVAQAALPMVRNDSIIALVIHATGTPKFRDGAPIFNPAHRKPFEALLDWAKFPEPDFNAEIQQVYENTLAYVGGTYRSLIEKDSPRVILRRIMYLGVFAPALFHDFVEERRPRALAILANHLAISQAVEEHWWVRGVAEREVHGIQSILPAEWQWAMEWPLSMVVGAKPE